jgi:hypothetical protein
MKKRSKAFFSARARNHRSRLLSLQALIDFKKEKISRQNARLSLANSAYENPSMPYRKILLQTGSANYRPPVERGKAAPKLKVIEEVIFEEDEEETATSSSSSSTPTLTLTPTLATLERCYSEPLRDFRTSDLRQVPILFSPISAETFSIEYLHICTYVLEYSPNLILKTAEQYIGI